VVMVSLHLEEPRPPVAECLFRLDMAPLLVDIFFKFDEMNTYNRESCH
jgi:hypothetical protein